MTNPIDIAASGLSAASLWLESSAANLANMQSFGVIPGAGVPSGVYQPTAVLQTADADGGVHATLAAVRPAYRIAYNPASTLANGQGHVAEPNIDAASQIVSLTVAAQSYSANIATRHAADRAQRTLLDALV